MFQLDWIARLKRRDAAACAPVAVLWGVEAAALRRALEGFRAADWDAVESAVAVAGSLAKFGQSAALRRRLLATGQRLLVEGSSLGGWVRCGRGYGYPEEWGENRLWVALMEVRSG